MIYMSTKDENNSYESICHKANLRITIMARLRQLFAINCYSKRGLIISNFVDKIHHLIAEPYIKFFDIDYVFSRYYAFLFSNNIVMGRKGFSHDGNLIFYVSMRSLQFIQCTIYTDHFINLLMEYLYKYFMCSNCYSFDIICKNNYECCAVCKNIKILSASNDIRTSKIFTKYAGGVRCDI